MNAEALDPGRPGVFDPGVLVGSLPARVGGEDDSGASHSDRPARPHQDLRDSGRHSQPFTAEPILTDTKCRWNMMNNTTAGRASTNAPAMIAPYRFVATDDPVLM